MGFVGAGRGGVSISLHIVVRVKVKEGFGEGGFFRVIGKTKIGGDY